MRDDFDPFEYEQHYWGKGYALIAGVDEAGRGPWAGPVVAAACIIPKGVQVRGVDDSKKLSPARRREVLAEIQADPRILYGVGAASVEEIDSLNILQATLVAISRAVAALSKTPDLLLIDGVHLKHATIPSVNIVKGDSLSHSIAAASVIAKETRDALMCSLHAQWPQYGFDQHKGYGTAAHQAALQQHGPCPIHRTSYKPIQALLTS